MPLSTKELYFHLVTFIFVLIFIVTFGVISLKLLPNTRSEDTFLCFCGSFVALPLTSRSVLSGLHCEEEVQLHSVACGNLISQRHFLRRLFFLLVKNQLTKMYVFIPGSSILSHDLCICPYVCFVCWEALNQCEAFWQVSRNFRNSVGKLMSHWFPCFPSPRFPLLLLFLCVLYDKLPQIFLLRGVGQ
jgi:hypothetical protein